MPDLILLPLALLLGLVVGSGVAAVAARMPVGQALLAPPHCLRTGQRLTWAEALPLVGFFVQGGRCRHCGWRLPGWVPVVEASMGGIALLSYNFAGPTPRFLVYLAEGAVLLLILVMDWRHHDVYTLVVGAGAVIALLGGALLPEIGVAGALAGGLGGGLVMLALWGLGWVLGRALYGKPGLAFGDVLLGALIGLMTGFPGVVAPLFWGPVLGAGIALLLLFTRRKGLHDYFPYGPGLCLAALAYVLTHASPLPLWDVLSLGLFSNLAGFMVTIVEKLVTRLTR